MTTIRHHVPPDISTSPATETGSYRRATIALALTATVAVMPGFALGAMAAPIRTDLGISGTDLGLAMSAFYGTSALGSPLTTRLAARLPLPVALATAAMTAAAAMAAIARVHTLTALITVSVLAGITNGLVQPTAGRIIAHRVPARRRSLVAGIVGAALGAATFVPGLLAGFVVEPYGWRPAMTLAALVAVAVTMLAPLVRSRGGNRGPAAPTTVPADGPAAPAPSAVRRVLPLWAIAAALSATGNNTVASYFVELGHHAGLATTVAANLLSVSAVIAIGVRIAVGLVTDRAPHRNPTIVAAMMLTGATGLALIATSTPTGFLIGAIAAFAAGWGWTGLLLATTLQLVPGRAEQAGHTVQIGVYTGAAIAPFTFSALSTTFGFDTAALVAAGAGLLATVFLTTGAKLLHRRVSDGSARPSGLHRYAGPKR